MQFLAIRNNYTLEDLSDRVGDRNVEHFLSDNDLQRVPQIGKQYNEKVREIYQTEPEVPWQRKSTILNKFVDDSDVFEECALMDENSWKVMSSLGTFPDMIKVPETITLPNAADVLGNSEPVGTNIYKQAMNQLSKPPHVVSPEIFNDYSVTKGASLSGDPQGGNTFNNIFPIPWGDITIYSELAGKSLDIPVYPEELQDSVHANYTQMPELIYQYEPWQLYQSSGPRVVPLSFVFHRDMWSGDCTDGKANELIRFFEAMCYPEYNGSAVNSDIATLYIKGDVLVRGIITEVSKKWSGPILKDGFYAVCDLSVSFTEVSEKPLSASVIRNKSLIG